MSIINWLADHWRFLTFVSAPLIFATCYSIVVERQPPLPIPLVSTMGVISFAGMLADRARSASA